VNKKEAILKSVLKLVNREGFYHLNMKKIASEAGIASGTIYLYFKGKEDLINDLYHLAISEFNQAVLKAYVPNQAVPEGMYQMLRAAIEFYLQNPDHFSFIEQYTYSPFIFKENREENFALLKPIHKILKAGKHEKLIDNTPDEILVAIIHGGLNTIMKLHLAKKFDLHKTKNIHLFCQSVINSIILEPKKIINPTLKSSKKRIIEKS